MSPRLDGLAEFLLARIADDAALLRPFNLRALVPPDTRRGYALIRNVKHQDIVAVDPWRLSAECKAKADIVRAYQETERLAGLQPAVHESALLALTTALRCLAAIYSDHRDYRGEWGLVVPL
jgi:Family of unknown function (DUF6221)